MHNPRPTYSIGPAVVSDIDTIDRIEREAFNTPWSRDLLRGAILNKQYQVRCLRSPDAELIGFYIAHRVGSRSNLDNLAVETWARGEGHGTRLITDWIENARRGGQSTLTLQVNTANRGAQRLYERFRFKTARLLVAYYPNGDDAYQMERATNPRPAAAEPEEKGRLIPKRARLALLSRP